MNKDRLFILNLIIVYLFILFLYERKIECSLNSYINTQFFIEYWVLDGYLPYYSIFVGRLLNIHPQIQ